MNEDKSKGNSFLNLFWKKEDATQEVTPQSNASADSQKIVSRTITGVPDKKFADLLAKVMDDNNFPGQDYYELKQALKAMENLPIAENAKFQAAYATLSTMGVSVPKLIETANKYIELLNKEKIKFGDETTAQIGLKVKAKEKDIQDLTVLNQKKSDQIQALTLEINTNQQTISKLRMEISENSVKIQNTKSNFDATHASYVNQIQSDIDKINSYLPK